jgi:exosome complex component RRP42
VDLYTLDMDGNLIDAGVLAGVAALLTAKMPKYDKEKQTVNYDVLEGPLPVNGKPISVTHAKVGNTIIVDPLEQEEALMNCRFTVGFNDAGEICAMQKGGVSGFTSDEIMRMTESSLKHVVELRALLP